MTEADDPHDLQQTLAPIENTRVAPAVGIAAIALNLALKYHDITTVQDGALYQQYKLEGRNFVPFHLDMVFETAMKMEHHLVTANQRIADIIMEVLEAEAAEEEQSGEKGADAPL